MVNRVATAGGSGGRPLARLARALHRGGGQPGLHALCCDGCTDTGTILEVA